MKTNNRFLLEILRYSSPKKKMRKITSLQLLTKLKASVCRWNSFQMDGGSSGLDNLGLYTKDNGSLS